jgi:predicted NAD/FAD-dependent oxidoreductase
MNTIPKKMAENITIQLNEKVTNIAKNQVFTESGNNYVFDYLLITIPMPQIIDLLANANITLSPKDEITFNTIQYEPCIAVMAILKKPTEIPTGGIMLENQPVGWIADNFQKGITTIPTVTIHATATYSQAHLDADLQLTARHLLSSVSQWIPADNIEDFQVHRWRYSLAINRCSDTFYQLEQHPIFLAGDGFGMGNVEGAFLSGLSAAKAIHSSK